MYHLLQHPYTKFYWFIYYCRSFLVNQLVDPFNAWQKYLYRSRAQIFRDGKMRGLIGNRLQLHHFYVSTFYNWIWHLQLSRGALALHSSSKLHRILGDAAILYIIIFRTSRNTQWCRCFTQHVRIVDFIRLKLYVIITSSYFNRISN